MAVPQTMRALQINQHGGPEVVHFNDAPVPTRAHLLSTGNTEAANTNILVKVEWAGVNFIDNYIREGIYPNRGAWPLTLGQEAGGTIVELPPDDSPAWSDPEFVRRGFKVGAKVGAQAAGSYAEYVSAPWRSVFPLPQNIDTRTAAAALLQGLTVVTMTHESYPAKKGDWILVHAAAGGLGLIFCQILSAMGCHVIGTTSTKEKAALAKAHGAEDVIIYSGPDKEDVEARVLDLTGGQGVHGIYDGVGKDTWELDFKVIRLKGTIVFAGNASGVVPPFPVLKLSEKNVKITRPTLMNNMKDPVESGYWADMLFGIIQRGELNLNIHRDYPFTPDGLRDTVHDLKGRVSTGKLLVKIANDS